MAERLLAARPTASVSLTFGLVSVPIKLYAAARPRDVAFNLVHKECGGRARQGKSVCDQCHNDLEREEIGRAFQYEKGRYVEVTPEDFDRIDQALGKAVEVLHFVDGDQVPQVGIEKSYYVGPEDESEKAYALLYDALESSHRVAICKYRSGGKEELVVVAPIDGRLVMQQMFWPDEVREPAFRVPEVELSSAEKQMAQALLDNMTLEEIDWSQFEDSYRVQLEGLIAAKIDGTEPTLPTTKAQPKAAEDLMAALRASLESTKKVAS